MVDEAQAEAIYGGYGGGTFNWSQILRAVPLSISPWRGTLVRLPVLVFQ